MPKTDSLTPTDRELTCENCGHTKGDVYARPHFFDQQRDSSPVLCALCDATATVMQDEMPRLGGPLLRIIEVLRKEIRGEQGRQTMPDRVADTREQAGDRRSDIRQVRPKLDSWIGQEGVVRQVRIAIKAAKERGETMDHALLAGNPGLGKTAMARAIAEESGAEIHITSGPALRKAGDVAALLTNIADGDIVFIDEIHGLSRNIEEFLYPAMTDCEMSFSVDSEFGPSTQVQLDLEPFTLIGATTLAGKLSKPMRDRFGLLFNLGLYEPDELSQILANTAAQCGIKCQSAAREEISLRSRGTPRIALRLFRRVRDYAQVTERGQPISLTAARDCLKILGIDERGLDEQDREYLRILRDVYKGGPVGVEAIAATMGEPRETLEDVVEPFLLKLELIARTRKGRELV